MKRLGIALLPIALVAGACTSARPLVTSSESPIPSVSIASCQTTPGSRAPAAPKGVAYATQLKRSGELNIGSDNAYPPFEEIKAGAKTPSGFDVDLYTEVARRLGLTAKSTTTNFDALFTQSIPSGIFDVGVSAITIKESRKKSVDFSIPYFVADLSLAVNETKTPQIKTIDDLKGTLIGVQSGTTGEDCANYLKAQGLAKDVKRYDDASLAFQDLAAGRISSVVNDRPASQGFIEKNTDLKVVQVITTKERYGFAISRSKPDLRVAIDRALTEIMTDGTYATIYRRWFGTEPPFAVPLS